MPANGLDVQKPEESLVPVISQQQLASADFFQEPKRVLDRAEKVAKALKKFLDRKKKKVEFNGERYPQAEDWQFVGAFFGHTARVRSTIEVKDDDGMVIGYVATAEVLNASQKVVSAAEAACMRDEPNWMRKPDFQLRSMAQTRACAKGLRNVFAWVMIMAGLAPTPAEEMSESNGNGMAEVVAAPRRKSEIVNSDSTISIAQQKRLFALAHDAGKTNDQVRELIGRHGFEHSHEIRRNVYDTICAELRQ